MSETMDVPGALRNVVVTLQQKPALYRAFGIYWWPIKALLKGAGYTREHLFMLGAYVDQDQAGEVPEGDLRTTLAAAFEEFAHNARYPRPDGKVETPDGELVLVVDPDAGGL